MTACGTYRVVIYGYPEIWWHIPRILITSSSFLDLLVLHLTFFPIFPLILYHTIYTAGFFYCTHLETVNMAIPTFAGLSGKKLGLTVSTIATMGFLLFGYDRKLPP